MPNTRISDLTAAVDGSLAGANVFPSVQTAGVGPVKTSLTQITAFALANAPAGAVATPSIAPTGDTNTGFWFPAADTIAASTGGSERLRINSSGNVGIGTTSPTAYTGYTTLEVKGVSGGGGGLFKSTSSDGVVSAEYYSVSGGGAGAFFGTTTAHPLIFLTSGTGRMRITSAGDFLLNSTTTGRSGIVIGNTAGGVSLDGTGGTYANWGGSYGIYTRTGVGLGIGSAFAISFEVNGTPRRGSN